MIEARPSLRREASLSLPPRRRMARAHARSPESGFSIMEAVVATLIATIAVLGLASSFGSARGLVDRYAEARVALAAAQRRMEILSVLDANAPELQIGTAHQADVVVDNAIVARESWTIAAFDDPANGTGAGQTDLKQVTVTVSWGAGAPAEQVQLVRLFPAQ